MQNILSDMPYFTEVAKRKSFTKAADALDIPLPTISRRIAALEKRLNIKLFNRHSRKVELTEAGKQFLESCQHIVDEAQHAVERLMQEQQSCSGPIRISIPPTTYFICLQGALSEFTAQHPGIEMHLNFANRWVDLYSEPFDLEIRTGELPDSSLKARKLISGKTGIYASPSFIEKYPAPERPEDLENLPYIHMNVFRQHGMSLSRGKETVTVFPQVKHSGNSPAVAWEFVLAGQGVALIELTMAQKLEKAGRLLRLLPEWDGPGLDIHLVRAEGKTSYRVQLFSDYLVEHFKKFQGRML